MQTHIRPGQIWLDTKGERIQAHGAGMFYEDGWYYWYGEDKTYTRKKGKLWTWGIKCYRSQDLVNWEDLGHIIEPAPDDKNSLFHPNRRMDRPHIIKNQKTGKYVLWLKFCDKAHFAILTADALLGPYSLIRPCFRPDGRKAGDFDLTVDEDTGKGYLYVELDHREVLVYQLTEDYCDVTDRKAVVYTGLRPPFSREAPTYFRHNGKHYLMTSGMTGYVPNPSEIAVAEDYMGPYTVLGDPHIDDDSSASFNSQPSCAFRIEGTDQIIIMADRWVPEYVMTKERYDVLLRAISSRYNKEVKCTFKEKMQLMTMPMMGSANTSIANYVWLPVEWEGEKPVLRWRDAWNPEELK